MQNVTRKQLKSETKQLFKGHWGEAITANIVPIILAVLGTAFIVFFSGIVSYVISHGGFNFQDDYAYSSQMQGGDGGSAIWQLIRQIVMTMLSVGISYTFLDWFRDDKSPERPFASAFQGFNRTYALSTFAITLLTIIFTTLWSLLLLIPGIIKGYSYSQAFFIYKDHVTDGMEKPGFLEAITESRKLMDGHKWDLFWLDLSFLGWFILTLFTAGIGFIWLYPYYNATRANFYRHLKDNQVVETVAAPAAATEAPDTPDDNQPA